MSSSIIDTMQLGLLSTKFLEDVGIILIISSLHVMNYYKYLKYAVLVGITGILISIASFLISIFNTYLVESHHLSRIVGIIITMLVGSFIGYQSTSKVQMELLPEIMALLHSLVGLCAMMTDFNFCIHRVNIGKTIEFDAIFGIFIGSITFSGSISAFLKLQNNNILTNILSKFINIKRVNLFNAIILSIVLILSSVILCHQSMMVLYVISILSILLGITSITFIGGSDMAIAISILNSYSGWSAMCLGFVICNNTLITTGIIVGVSGAMLSHFMCKSMNKSILGVIFNHYAKDTLSNSLDKPVKMASPNDVAFSLMNSSLVVIIPGYGMSISRSQHVIKSIMMVLKQKNIEVWVGVHPVAGRMPGHMDVLLADANIDYSLIKGLNEVNASISIATILVVGANDIINSSAKNDKYSPLYGMQVFDVENAQETFIIKRSMSHGYAGIDNPSFYAPNARIVLGEAKKICEDILSGMNEF
ncbi:NAD(P)(+) transhydrogenase (Re/Si-specific) subunit beta [Candidatus Gromoviella agglomerans]|uniref:NAD(P)(+) transhydrogenase (Re/Si-specific) subunit beta n=1 Tax=Candidatus Gromoviella agglomerans TaxID=2806609 RepID=UPI001E518CA4|nr:NAD(P)(+) transhydrogenase (Re/Si-specific) subunit beta [Candidatus Gromoviella agglomerans]UFX98182.1 NAD(P)(+) transhydrogenase (Re/Si-specific) subunit beta [Candidatus Gromoviella agglomerans]